MLAPIIQILSPCYILNTVNLYFFFCSRVYITLLSMLLWQDSRVPIWGNRYTSRRFYHQVFSNMDAHPIFKAVWKSSCTPRIKFFCMSYTGGSAEHKINASALTLEHTGFCHMCHVQQWRRRNYRTFVFRLPHREGMQGNSTSSVG